MLKALRERDHVIKNRTMFAALFLDPRYKPSLNQGESQTAMCELLSLHGKIQRKQNANEGIDKTVDEIEMMLMAAELGDTEQTDADDQNSAIQLEFERFKRLKRIEKEASVLDFWKENKTKFPILYELSQVLFSVSNGQTSVERAFSSLDYVFSNRRCNLDANILNDILLIRLNSDLFDALTDADWDEIIREQSEGLQNDPEVQ